MDEMITGVVVGYDGSDEAAPALEWAARDAERRAVPLTICHVWYFPYSAGGAPLMPDMGPDFARLEADIVDEGVDRAQKAAPGVRATGRLEYGSPASTLLRMAGETSLLVVGARGHTSVGRQVLGSVSGHAAAHGSGPVVTVRAAAQVPPESYPGSVVVGVDGSDTADRALAFAFGEASLRGLPLHVACALRPGTWDVALPPYVTPADLRELTGDKIRRAVAVWGEKYPAVEETVEIHDGDPVDHLLTAGKTAQLLVVGSRGLGGLRGRLLGSVSQAVLFQSRCPVAVIH